MPVGARAGVLGPPITDAGRGEVGYPTVDPGRLDGGEWLAFRADGIGVTIGPLVINCRLAPRPLGALGARYGSESSSSDAPSAWKNFGLELATVT